LSFGGTVKKGEPVQELTFNFRYAPWADVLEMFAAAAGLTLDLNVTPVGTFNYFDDKKYTPTQALDVINGYLLRKGYLIVQRDQFLVVWPCDDPDKPIPPNLVPIVTVEELAKRGNNELLEVDIQLEGLDAKEAEAEVQELIGPYGKVVGLALSNRLVIRDTGANLRRIHRLLSGVKVDGDRIFRRFQLEHLDVADAEILVRELFGLPSGATNVSSGSISSRLGYSSYSSRYSSSRDPRSSSSRTPTPEPKEAVNVATDERTNSLLITASPENMKIAEEAIEAIDVASNGSGRLRNNDPYLEVYQLTSATAQEVAKTLGVLYPGTVVNEDSRSGRLHIQATPKMHKDIAEAIRRLDGIGGDTQIAVIELGRLDAYTATASIQSLFFDDVNAPVIQPHPIRNALILRGQLQQIEQIRTLLQQMDPTDRAKGGGNVRTIPLGGRNAKEFADILEKMINNSGRAKIRQIVPSSSGPIRSRRIPGIGEQGVPTRSPTALPNIPFDIKRQPAAQEVPPKTDDTIDKTVDAKATNTTEKAGSSDKSAAARIHRQKFEAVFATYRTETPAYDEQEIDVVKNASQEDASSDETPAKEPAPEPEKKTSATDEIPTILLTVQNGNLIAISTDQDALDALEEMVDALAEVIPAKNQWTVFYLQSADAMETATVLERIFPTSSVSTTSTSGGGGLLGELTGGLSSMGRGLMNMSGLDMLTSGPMTLRIIPDLRTNSLFVSGPPHLVDEVEDTLAILDASELPEQLRARTPRYIEVKHADVNEVADMIRDVYKEEMTAPQQSRGGGQNPLAALMGGGGGGRGSSRGGSGGGASRIKLTLGVDSRNSRLVVSASEALYLQIEGMVKQIDDASQASIRTTRVIPLEHANTAILKQTLATLMPRVRVSSSSTSSRSSGSSSQPSSSGRPSTGDIQRFLQMRQGGGSSSRPSGTSSSRGTSSGRPSFGGGSGRSSFGGGSGRPSFGGGGGGRPSFGGGGGDRGRGGR
jgi:type II secretory pathway component GspD/PulD (secretin)